MPINQQAGVFTRLFRWATLYQPGSAWQRADADLNDDDVAAALNVVYARARQKSVPLSDLPPTGFPFEQIVTLDPDGNRSLREWRLGQWVRMRYMLPNGSVVVIENPNSEAVDVTAPPAPENWTALELSTGVVLAGDASPADDFESFVIYEGADEAAFIDCAEVARTRSTNFIQAGMTLGVARSFYVTAIDFSGNESLPTARIDAQPTGVLEDGVTVPLARVTGAGTAAAADTGTGAANVPTTAQADARYARLSVANVFTGPIQTTWGNNSANPPLQLADGDSGKRGFTGVGTTDVAVVSNGEIVAQFVPGASASLDVTVITREKGDARYLLESNNLSDLTSYATARTNLGLGTLATQDEGTGNSNFRDNAANDARFAPVAGVPGNFGAGRFFADFGTTLLPSFSFSADQNTGINVLNDADGRIYFIIDGGIHGIIDTIDGGSNAKGLLTRDGAAALYASIGDAWPGVYTGSSSANTTFPIGTPLSVGALSPTAYNRNASGAVRLHSSIAGAYINNGAGALLTGTWRSRGYSGAGDGSSWYIMQRVA